MEFYITFSNGNFAHEYYFSRSSLMFSSSSQRKSTLRWSTNTSLSALNTRKRKMNTDGFPGSLLGSIWSLNSATLIRWNLVSPRMVFFQSWLQGRINPSFKTRRLSKLNTLENQLWKPVLKSRLSKERKRPRKRRSKTRKFMEN